MRRDSCDGVQSEILAVESSLAGMMKEKIEACIFGATLRMSVQSHSYIES